MSRILLLCFIHGFKGDDDTFHEFPYDLKKQVSRQLPDHRIESVVYPKYETKGELAEATHAFRDWLKERVMDARKAHLEKPWPPNDRDVGVVLVAHSMGGFVAADTLFLTLADRAENEADEEPPFPLIQGILTFDTAYNGLARSMFVYGAFSNYQKVSSVFNVMTAIGSAAPLTLGRLGTQRAATTSASMSTMPSAGGPSQMNPAWKTWQLVAVRTGTVGAIAAGGVAAYMNREAIVRGVQSVKNINRESVAEGYRQSMETLGQGLAYINRGSVGHSFAWLSDHFTFVGALMKQKELSRRLERMAALEGVGIKDFYISLGENGYWSGGYFVPERTFCAVPDDDHPASSMFSRCVMRGAEDELHAHLSMFEPEKNKGYERMTDEAAELVVKWFLSDAPIVDDPKYREPPPDETAEDEKVEKVLSASQEDLVQEGEKKDEGEGGVGEKAGAGENQSNEKGGLADQAADELPDESPIDIAAAASLVPLPEDGEGDLVGETGGDDQDVEQRKKTYRQYLFQIAQQTGTGAKAWWPSKMPNMPNMPSVGMPNMPAMPNVSAAVSSSLGQVSMPSVPRVWGKKQDTSGAGTEGEGTKEETGAADAEAERPETAQEKPQEATTESEVSATPKNES